MFLTKIPVSKTNNTSMSDKFNMDITDYLKKNGNRKYIKDFKSEPVQDDKTALENKSIQHSRSCDYGN